MRYQTKTNPPPQTLPETEARLLRQVPSATSGRGVEGFRRKKVVALVLLPRFVKEVPDSPIAPEAD